MTIVAKQGLVNEREMFLIEGQIISSKKNNEEIEVVEFEQLKINLKNFVTTTIKQPKLQETSTKTLFNCIFNQNKTEHFCKNKEAKKRL